MSSSDIFLGETIGTAVLILLGGGVCAVLTGAYMVGGVSGAHLNPAVTVGLAIEGGTKWSDVPLYLASQLLGAMIGAVLVYAAYAGQFRAHLTDPAILEAHAASAADDEGLVDPKAAPAAGPVLGVFSTGPEIRNVVQNMTTEIIATTVLVLAILTQGLNDNGNGIGVLGALITALVVVSIGLSLGGPTGYAINPVRDLGPRIVHSLLPLPNKGGSDWSYAWIPVAGPLIGGALAGFIYKLF
ncbi:MIP/aquaporin family protein [Streptomyces sp. NPDC057694]|uniref:MIP/aquaporin family protein n=1 Tax=Streptomyces sp. NPDC057694 TaxID=3346216 RepID=UPI003693BFCA